MSACAEQAPEHEDLTLNLADQIVSLAERTLDSEVLDHAKTHLFNALGLAISAAGHPASSHVVRLGKLVGRPGTSVVPGTWARLDPQYAAFATGVAAHVDDFDDTHLATVIHPSASSMAAAIALGVPRGTDGPTLLRAFLLGCEAQLRVGLAMSPSHYAAGWHITGTCGVVGAAVSSGLILGLDGPRLTQAIGVAASMTLGQRESFGTMLKALHAGKAAANGVLAALLVEQGFTGSTRGLEATRGMISVLSDRDDLNAVLTGLGSSWAFLDNKVKPYPCGIVIHPVIDAGIELAPRIEHASNIRSVHVRCHPLVGDLTGIVNPTNDLEARFSAVHGLAVALVTGEFGLSAYLPSSLDEGQVTRLRSIASLQFDAGRSRDSAVVTVELSNGRTIEAEVEHARGSENRPLSGDEVFAKIASLIGTISAQRLWAAIVALDSASDLNDLVRAVTPGEDKTSRE